MQSPRFLCNQKADTASQFIAGSIPLQISLVSRVIIREMN